MKKLLISCIIVVMLTSFAAFAEDLSALTLDQLTERRQQLLEELSQVNAAISAASLQQPAATPATDGTLGRIIDLFPDEAFAKIIRDECAKFSIDHTVTQADLDQITRLTIYDEEIKDFTGIRYLRNLKSFTTGQIYQGPIPAELQECRSLEYLSMEFDRGITEIPEWVADFERLQMLDLPGASFTALPDCVCGMLSLTHLSVGDNESLSALPDRIGDLINLRELSIHDTSVSVLPDSVGQLVNLKALDIANTPIASLPESIYALQLTSLDMSGTSIR